MDIADECGSLGTWDPKSYIWLSTELFFPSFLVVIANNYNVTRPLEIG